MNWLYKACHLSGLCSSWHWSWCYDNGSTVPGSHCWLAAQANETIFGSTLEQKIGLWLWGPCPDDKQGPCSCVSLPFHFRLKERVGLLAHVDASGLQCCRELLNTLLEAAIYVCITRAVWLRKQCECEWLLPLDVVVFLYATWWQDLRSCGHCLHFGLNQT